MKNINLTLVVLVCVIFVLCTNQTFAFATTNDLEDALGFSETVNDVPEAPIHFLVGLFLAVGTFLGIRNLK